MKITLRPTYLLIATFCAVSAANAQTTIDANTDYSFSDFAGQTLQASAADLGTTRMFAATLSNTSWSGGVTTTPHFSAMANQNFRQAQMDGADWNGVTFTSDGSGNQYFYQGNYVNTNFSNTVFNLTSSNSISEAFKDADLSGTNFSGASITTTSSDIFEGATMNSATDFSNSTLMLGTAITAGNLASTGGANFSGATLRIDLRGTDISNTNFQNVTFVASDGINSVIRLSTANNTDFRGTDFSGVSFANWLESLTFDPGSAPLYDDSTLFVTQNGTFDPVAAGWNYSPIPEPGHYAAMVGVLSLLAIWSRRKRN